MNLSCCTWTLSGIESSSCTRENLAQIANVGFRTIDIREADLRADADLGLVKELGLTIHCLSASFSIPPNTSLDHENAAARAQAVQAIEGAIQRATEVGASAVYIIPSEDGHHDPLARYADSVTWLADRAAEHGLKLMIEHFPGKALPTVERTLDFLRTVDHPNLSLLFDIGHAQIAREDIHTAILNAGPLLGYVHLDDNDGENDLHWALLDGVMKQESLVTAFDALKQIGYDGPASLELHWELPDPLAAIQRSWDVLQTIEEEPMGNG